MDRPGGTVLVIRAWSAPGRLLNADPLGDTTHTSMFTLIRVHDLSQQHFEQYPAWADYSEPDDIEEIVRWGVERGAVVAELERVHYSDEFVFPILRTDPLPSFRFLYLRAEFTAADGSRFAGYVIGEHPYCVAVFHGNEDFGFNATLPDLADEELARLRRVSRLPLTPFFPLRYSTTFRRDDGERIEGQFDFDRTA